jgi:hypothetical protein
VASSLDGWERHGVDSAALPRACETWIWICRGVEDVKYKKINDQVRISNNSTI